jgi:5'-nucleotidase
MAELRRDALLDVAGVKVGIIGLANPDRVMTLPANFAGLRALPSRPRSSRRRETSAGGAAVVVVVAHAGGTCARSTAPTISRRAQPTRHLPARARAAAGTVDAIVAGHTHAGIAHRVAGIPIIEAYDKGSAFGRIDLSVRSEASRRGRREDLSAAGDPKPGLPSADRTRRPLAPDAAVATAIAPALAAARARASDAGRDGRPSHRARYATESPLGNLFTDLMRAARPKADVALTTGGSLRASCPPAR